MDNMKSFLGISPTENKFPAALADDVKLIDRMLGRLLVSEGEERLIDIARSLYQQCYEEGGLGHEPRDAAEMVANMMATHKELNDPATVSRVLRAFTIFFQLINIAEQKEIVHANRRRQMAKLATSPRGQAWRPESIGAAISRLADAGVTASEMQTILDRVEIVPTITAHPTEARRRVVMDKLLAFADGLSQRELPPDASRLDRPLDLPGPHAEDELFRQLTALWNTDELRSGRMSVMDEVNNSVYFFQRTIIDVVAWLHNDLKGALRAAFPDHEFRIGSFIRYHSWVGGDRDGNPNVTPDVTWATVLYHHQVILSYYLGSIDPLKRELSLSSRILEISDELATSLEQDAIHITLPQEDLDRFRLQPFALKLTYVQKRLQATLARAEHMLAIEACSAVEPSDETRGAYNSVAEFIDDLEIIQRALSQPSTSSLAEGGLLQRLLVQANTFGFQMASLDVRQHSNDHAQVLGEILTAAGVLAPGEVYGDLPEERKLEILDRELRSSRPLLHRGWKGSAQSMKALKVFDVIRFAREMLGDKSITAYVISMTHQVSDMLEVLVLAKEAGLARWVTTNGDADSKPRLESDLDIVPLFETIEDLQNCDTLLRQMFANPTFRLHLDARGNFQELMLGYSDSSKDGGYLAANWNLQDTQDRLATACQEAGVDFRFFHGRGGTVGRGGGRASRAILSQPRGSFTGRIRFTEQGEVVSFRYALRPMAHRHLEQIVNSVLLAVYNKPERIFGQRVEEDKATPSPEANSRSHDRFGPAMVEMAAHSRKVYRAMVHEDPEFWEFYTQATPIAHISQLPITSRPAARGGGPLNGMEELRAIPWVFAWVQSRYVVPGWYGLGSGLEAYASRGEAELEQLRAMYRDWPFFRTVVDNAQLELVRTHLPTAANYAGRVKPKSLGARFHKTIVQEYERSAKWVLAITGQEHLLDKAPVVQSTVELRNPAVFPLNRLQVMLMEMWDNLPPDQQNRENAWNEPLLLSITSIAAGMQSTG
jgi:phosphoenolpyruvate carboxylase